MPAVHSPYQSSLSRLVLLLTRLTVRDRRHPSTAGLTLLECLVAIMVIAVTVAAITPPIFVAVATRIQNQKAEQAQLLAQQEIDRIRVLVERGTTNLADLPPVPASSGSTTFQGFEAPNSAPAANTSLNDRSQANSARRAYLADVDNDGREDFLVQIYRDSGTLNDSGQVAAFMMGVRVYAASPQTRQNLAAGTLQVQQAALKFVTGRGQQVSRPLAAVYSEVARSDSNLSSDQQCRQLIAMGRTLPAGQTCPSPSP